MTDHNLADHFLADHLLPVRNLTACYLADHGLAGADCTDQNSAERDSQDSNPRDSSSNNLRSKSCRSSGTLLPIGRRVALLCLAGLITFVAAPGITAQESQSPVDFFDSIDVEIVNVDVFVTDRKGNPISGLTAQDFEIYHDNEKVPITNFYASSTLLQAEESVGTAQATNPTSSVPPPDIDQRLNLVIFIDNQNISPKTRNRVIKALRGSLFFNLQPEDRVTLAAYDGSLQIRKGLTGDPRDLAEALDEIAEGGATGAFSRLERSSILRDLQQTDLESDVQSGGAGFSGGAGADWLGILQSIRNYSHEEYGRTVATVNTMGRFVDTLSGLPGRKALIYVSDGLSLRPGEALFQAFQLKAPPGTADTNFESREFDATQLFEALGKKANASRVTFYTILAAGRSSQTLTAAERSAFFDPNADAATLGQVWSDSLESVERSNFRGSMEILAEATGGLATLSTYNFSKALRRVKQDLSTFYSLGYQAPQNDLDNHKIKVEVKKDRLKVRHRESFRLRSSEEQMAVRTRSALLFSESNNPFGVRLEFGPPQKSEEGAYLVPLFVKFPFDKIVLAPIEGSHQGQVSIYVGARDVDGGISPVQKTPAPIKIPDAQLEAALSQLAGYRLMLQLRPGEHVVAVSVRDEISKSESTAVVSIDAEKLVKDLAEAAAQQASTG